MIELLKESKERNNQIVEIQFKKDESDLEIGIDSEVIKF
jgi:hypothetical protein